MNPSKKIENKEYVKRRLNLMNQMMPGSVAVIPSAQQQLRNADSEHLFRQSSDLYYLTGLNEPEAVLICTVDHQKQQQSILFCRERDPKREIWDGIRLGQTGAVENLKVEQSFPIGQIDKKMPGILSGMQQVYCSFDASMNTTGQVTKWLQLLKQQVRKGAEKPTQMTDLDTILHEMRLIKSDAEIAVMQSAADITVQGFKKAFAAAKPGISEMMLEAELRYEFAKNGAQSMAYNAIVASGPNACILHYNDNNRTISDRDLILIDAGCELDGYASDITRTFPVSGMFTAEQKSIYELVLKAQTAVIDMVKPGVAWNELHDKTVEIITDGLIALGLIEGTLASCIENVAYKSFFMHNTGHWLGLDVHDAGNYKKNGQWRVLEPGMVFTVEPGIYIASDNQEVAPKWRGIGIRIEDDIVVTDQGHHVLTCDIPRQIDEIRLLMQDKP